jgi:hypothetical protein
MPTDRNERLRRAAAAAVARLQKARDLSARRSGPPIPGDLYVFPVSESAALEWLVLRAHPDDPDLLLVIPCDDFPLAGTADVPLLGDPAGHGLYWSYSSFSDGSLSIWRRKAKRPPGAFARATNAG